jgi:threonyl-tRNA synthetase
MMRVRAFTQDDAHIFCTPEQITGESIAVCQLILGIYRDFGFEDVRIKFADRPEVRVGEDEVWDQSEAALLKALEVAGLDYTHNPGEGAFYGPKLEFVLRDAIGRDWQCGTLQVDLNMPGRLGATYIGEDGEKHLPVMLHRAMFGSLERFIGILIEHHAGNLPLWLAPVQVKVLTITSDADEYAREVVAEFEARGLRAEADLRNEKISYKVREHSVAKVPVQLAVGQREVENRSVAMRRLGSKHPRIRDAGTALKVYRPGCADICAPTGLIPLPHGSPCSARLRFTSVEEHPGRPGYEPQARASARDPRSRFAPATESSSCNRPSSGAFFDRSKAQRSEP